MAEGLFTSEQLNLQRLVLREKVLRRRLIREMLRMIGIENRSRSQAPPLLAHILVAKLAHNALKRLAVDFGIGVNEVVERLAALLRAEY